MARSDTLPIFLETYKFVLEVYKCTFKFPREYKFCLGQEMNLDALRLLTWIFQANHHQDKSAYLDEFLAAFEKVRLEIRLCVDLNVLTVRKLAHLSVIMDGIAEQANAWQKYETTQALKKKGENKTKVLDKNTCQNQT